ncbi:pre-peptidase C-terminal domain-containing protein [uncultured Jannaschia sp.]|uniref:pre-peptidase C-terminal domain-containing protein n=1 Tax=uncultured Jannaschia sp. TaxID=293347 RepID=UPI0026384134|nr:pre-peptidase C-terminal domain-containing protein [uncultured Jannaschia sp.]
MKRDILGRILEGGPQGDFLKGTGRNDVIFGAGGDDTIVGGRGVDLLFGGSGSDVFIFNDRDAGDVSFGRADTVGDFSSEDTIDLSRTEVIYFAGYDVVSPERGGFSIWEAQGDVYVTWNTFGKFHDVKLTDFQGDYYNLFSQIRWYDDDYAASVATRGSIETGATTTGEIEVAGDEDWFQINLAEGQLYTFDLQGRTDGGGTIQDPYLVLYDELGDYVTEGVEALSFVADASGTYFVSAGASGGTGTYTLTAAAERYADDFGNDASTAGEIASGETVTGRIGVPFDEDWFRIELADGETYVIDLRGQSFGFGSLPDPYLRLLDAEGSEVAFNDDADSLDSQIVYSADTAGTYYIAASELSSGLGSYELSVTELGNEVLIG